MRTGAKFARAVTFKTGNSATAASAVGLGDLGATCYLVSVSSMPSASPARQAARPAGATAHPTQLPRSGRRSVGVLVALVIATWALLAPLAACQEPRRKRVSLSERETTDVEPRDSGEAPVRIAVGAMITPRAGYGYYRELLRYIGERIGRPVELVDRHSYAEINDLLRLGDIDVAFVCGGPYVEAQAAFGLELVAAPQAYGQTVYYSYIIVGADAPARSLKDLRGKTFAFADPASNSGALVPTHMLAQMGETPEGFFESVVYTYAHDKSIQAVAQGIVDGAAVDHLIWEYTRRTDPELANKTKVIAKSAAFGIPPVVARPGLDPRLKDHIRQVLLEAHEDPEGHSILERMMIDRFVPIGDEAYDSIRAMRRATEQLHDAVAPGN